MVDGFRKDELEAKSQVVLFTKLLLLSIVVGKKKSKLGVTNEGDQDVLLLFLHSNQTKMIFLGSTPRYGVDSCIQSGI